MSTKIISKANIISNVNYCKSIFPNICAMVKADAYGHGVRNILPCIADEVSIYGVANIHEAISLRIINSLCKIIVVGKTKMCKAVIANNISITIDCIDDCKQIVRVCKKYCARVNIHIAINTGMNRIGVNSMNEYLEILNYINRNSNYLNLEGIFTHCFDADLSKTHFYSQMKIFYEYVKLVDYKSIYVHIGGSYVLNHKIPQFVNLVRIGYFLYGYGAKRLKPVMQINAPIVKIYDCKAGENIGYGNNIINKDTTVAVISIGYADGLPRPLSKNYSVIVNSKKAKILGNICMDMTMIDVTNISCKNGDNAQVMTNASLIAREIKTSPYEILTGFKSLRGKSLIIDRF